MKDAPVIILDEATANVDPENEKELMEAVAELTHDKTVIMIAHRLKTVGAMPTKFLWSITARSSSRAPMTSWLLLTGSTAASWWSGSRPPGGRSDFTLHIIQQSPYQLN